MTLKEKERIISTEVKIYEGAGVIQAHLSETSPVTIVVGVNRGQTMTSGFVVSLYFDKVLGEISAVINHCGKVEINKLGDVKVVEK
jgi:hypothetical protein